MNKTIVYLVGISKYKNKQNDLPLCHNDILMMKLALEKGLNIQSNNIKFFGLDNNVTTNDFKNILEQMKNEVCDNIVLYFSGHGTPEGQLAFSNEESISIDCVINNLKSLQIKNKLLIIDSCHSGKFDIKNYNFSYDFDNVDKNGISILASCHQDETSGFNNSKNISLFTSFLIDALTYSPIIKKGKKYLTDINDLIKFFSDQWYKNNKTANAQNSVYKTNKILPFVFDVNEYTPEKIERFYEETEDFIIYEVSPLHTNQQKRYCVKVILRKPHIDDSIQIAKFTKVIYNKIKELNIFKNNSNFKNILKDKETDVIFCYFGLSEDDIINSTWVFRSILTKQNSLKMSYYKQTKDSSIIDDICVISNKDYNFIKSLTYCELSINEYKLATKELIKFIIDNMKCLCTFYEDLKNKLIDEKDFLANVEECAVNVNFYYFKLGNMPVSDKTIREWSDLCFNLASQAQKITNYFKLDKFNKSDKKLSYLINNDIVKYEEFLNEFIDFTSK